VTSILLLMGLELECAMPIETPPEQPAPEPRVDEREKIGVVVKAALSRRDAALGQPKALQQVSPAIPGCASEIK